DILLARPGELHSEMGNFALVLPVGPGFLIRRRIEVMMGIDQLRSVGGNGVPGRCQVRRRAKRRCRGQEVPARCAAMLHMAMPHMVMPHMVMPHMVMPHMAVRVFRDRLRVHDAAPRECP